MTGLRRGKPFDVFVPVFGSMLNRWNWQSPCRTAPVPPECPLRLHPNCRVNSEGHGSRRAGEFRPKSRRKSQQTLLHCWGIFSIKYLYVQLHPSGIKRKGLSEGCFQAGGHLGKGHMCFAGTVLFLNRPNIIDYSAANWYIGSRDCTFKFNNHLPTCSYKSGARVSSLLL